MFGTQLKYQIKCNRHFLLETQKEAFPSIMAKKESKGTKMTREKIKKK